MTMSLSEVQAARSPKMQALCDRVTAMAHGLGPQAKLPTMVELRRTLGTSGATVSAVLDELEAQKIIYRRHGVGIYVSPTLHHKSIVLVCDMGFLRGAGHSPFWDMMVDLSRERASTKSEEFGLHLTLPGAKDGVELQQGLRKDIQAGRVQGVLGVGLNIMSANWIVSCGVPLVAFAGPAPLTVGLDDSAVIKEGVATLERAGCRRIGLWMPIEASRPLKAALEASQKQMRVFKHALQKASLDFHPELVFRGESCPMDWNGAATLSTHQEQGYGAALSLL